MCLNIIFQYMCSSSKWAFLPHFLTKILYPMTSEGPVIQVSDDMGDDK